MKGPERDVEGTRPVWVQIDSCESWVLWTILTTEFKILLDTSKYFSNFPSSPGKCYVYQGPSFCRKMESLLSYFWCRNV